MNPWRGDLPSSVKFPSSGLTLTKESLEEREDDFTKSTIAGSPIAHASVTSFGDAGQQPSPFFLTASPPHSRVLSLDTLPDHLVGLEYAVRGPILDRAAALEEQLETHPESLGFKSMIPANIGNPQAVGQAPITFIRQVAACILDSSLMDKVDYEGKSLYPIDVVERCRRYLSCHTSFGAYTHSKGLRIFRDEISEWFHNRDGFPCDPESICLTNGASSGIRIVLELVIGSSADGVLIPVPQYPLYSATIGRMNGVAVEYYLDEESQWGFSISSVKRALDDATSRGINVKALVLVNPGNPTGSVMRESDVRNAIMFCQANSLLLLSDEVYQVNLYAEDAIFHPARKIAYELQSPVEVVTFHSCSKGLGGECGLRGGLMQFHNVSNDVLSVLYKLCCVALCANSIGQTVMTCLLNPPKVGEPSYPLYLEETTKTKTDLAFKAKLAVEKLNNMKGLSCQPINGSMYAFPRVDMPEKAKQESAKRNVSPDFLYCLELLEETGVICVPGSGFCQAPGTFHFRLTILPDIDIFQDMLQRIHNFNLEFFARYK